MLLKSPNFIYMALLQVNFAYGLYYIHSMKEIENGKCYGIVHSPEGLNVHHVPGHMGRIVDTIPDRVIVELWHRTMGTGVEADTMWFRVQTGYVPVYEIHAVGGAPWEWCRSYDKNTKHDTKNGTTLRDRFLRNELRPRKRNCTQSSRFLSKYYLILLSFCIIAIFLSMLD